METYSEAVDLSMSLVQYIVLIWFALDKEIVPARVSISYDELEKKSPHNACLDFEACRCVHQRAKVGCAGRGPRIRIEAMMGECDGGATRSSRS